MIDPMAAIAWLRAAHGACAPHPSHVINQDVVLVRYQLPGAGHTTGPAKPGVVDEATSLLFQQLIEGQSRDRVVGLDVVLYRFAVLDGFRRPLQFHHSDASSLRRGAA